MLRTELQSFVKAASALTTEVALQPLNINLFFSEEGGFKIGFFGIALGVPGLAL